MVPEYNKAVKAFQSTGVARKQIEQNVAGEVFKVYGDELPPDATFTLRISDGIVKGYEYNGTTAPIKTMYFGMYERYYSNDGKFPGHYQKMDESIYGPAQVTNEFCLHSRHHRW